MEPASRSAVLSGALFATLILLLCSAPATADDETDMPGAHSDAERAELRRVALEKTRQIRLGMPAGGHQFATSGLRAHNAGRAQLQRAANPTPPASHLAAISADSYADWLIQAAGGTVVVFFHASFCKQCPALLAQFAEAAATLAQRGYPEGIMAALDTSLGGSAAAGPRLFAAPCVSCPSCQGYPCIITIDVDDEGHSSGKLWGPRPITADTLVSMTVDHLENRGIMPGQVDDHKDGPSIAPKPASDAGLQLQVDMQAAAREGNIAKMTALLAAGADPNGVGGSTQDPSRDKCGDGDVSGWTALHEVAARGHCIECAVLLAANGANVSSLPVRDHRGFSAEDVARKAVRGDWDRVLVAEAESNARAQVQRGFSAQSSVAHDREL